MIDISVTGISESVGWRVKFSEEVANGQGLIYVVLAGIVADGQVGSDPRVHPRSIRRRGGCDRE